MMSVTVPAPTVRPIGQTDQAVTRKRCQGHQQASHAGRLYRRLNPRPDERNTDDRLNTPPPVPTTAIYTRGDGVVNWRTSLQQGDNHNVHNIRVPGSHIGLNVNAAVWFWIAKKLAEVDSRIVSAAP